MRTEKDQLLDIAEKIEKIRKKLKIAQIVLANTISKSQSYLSKRTGTEKTFSTKKLVRMAIFL